MRVAFSLVVFGGLLASGGCGEARTCQSSCRRVYQSGQCAVQIPGQTEQDLIRDCSVECRNALETPGEIGAYDPYSRAQAGSEEANYTLENEIQAATWMDCVWDLECDQLRPEGDGLCWPIP